MIIYWSMITVIALCAAANSMTKSNIKFNNRFRQSKFWIYVSMLYIIFWTGIRTQFVDTAAYIRTYADIPVSSLQSIYEYAAEYDKDQLFYFASGLFKYIFGDNYHYWLFAIAFLCGMCIVRQIYYHSDTPFFSLFLFMTMSVFTWMMNGIRQFVAISILFVLSDWLIDKRKRWIYIIAALILSLVHSSVLYALPFIVIVMFSDPWDWKMILLIVTVAIAITNSAQFIDVLTETVAQDYAETFNESAGSNIIRAIVAFVPVGIAFAGRRIIRRENDEYINLCINMSLVCALLYVLSSFTNGILVGRMPMYFQVYNLILLPCLIKRCFVPKDRRILTVICVICYLLYFTYQATVAGNYYYASDLTGFLGKNIW